MAPLFDLRQGDVLQRLREIPSDTVSCCVTSVPYWGLRSYNVPASVWGGSAQCPHVWTAEVPVQSASGLHRMPANQTGGTKDFSQRATNQGQFCFHCSAWRGCLGLEPTPAQYLANMVAVFREVRRVLHPSGTLWLNIGDSYCSDAGADRMPTTLAGLRVPAGWTNRAQPRRVHALRKNGDQDPKRRPAAEDAVLQGCASDGSLKPKDLCMMPARLALALQEDGWWLRCQIPWLKSNPMPESCTDRPGSSVEYIYLLAKSEAYFYDREAVRIDSSGNGHDRGQGVNPKAMGPNSGMKRDRDPSHQSAAQIKHRQNHSFSAAVHAVLPTRSRRNTDWFFASLESYTRGFQGLLVDGAADPLALLVNPQPFSLEMCVQCKTCYAQREYRKLELDGKTRRCCCGAAEWISHFATFPEQMVTPCILAGTSEHGRCRACGAPYERVVERSHVGDWHPDPGRKHDAGAVNGTAKWAKSAAVDARNGMKLQSSAGTGSHTKENPPAPATLGWRPTCSHPLFESEIVPCVVLDPFSGSGRTGLAANRHGRDFIGIEANGDYVRMAEWQKSKQTVERVGTP
jgi:DNA modification methylase